MAQIELASRAGVSLATVSRLEIWNFTPKPETAQRLAKTLHVSVRTIFPKCAR